MYKYICLYLWLCQFSMFLILNSLLHAVKLLCFEISIPSELQMTSDPLFSFKDNPVLGTILSSATIALQAMPMALLLRTSACMPWQSQLISPVSSRADICFYSLSSKLTFTFHLFHVLLGCSFLKLAQAIRVCEYKFVHISTGSHFEIG